MAVPRFCRWAVVFLVVVVSLLFVLVGVGYAQTDTPEPTDTPWPTMTPPPATATPTPVPTVPGFPGATATPASGGGWDGPVDFDPGGDFNPGSVVQCGHVVCNDSGIARRCPCEVSCSASGNVIELEAVPRATATPTVGPTSTATPEGWDPTPTATPVGGVVDPDPYEVGSAGDCNNGCGSYASTWWSEISDVESAYGMEFSRPDDGCKETRHKVWRSWDVGALLDSVAFRIEWTRASSQGPNCVGRSSGELSECKIYASDEAYNTTWGSGHLVDEWSPVTSGSEVLSFSTFVGDERAFKVACWFAAGWIGQGDWDETLTLVEVNGESLEGPTPTPTPTPWACEVEQEVNVSADNEGLAVSRISADDCEPEGCLGFNFETEETIVMGSQLGSEVISGERVFGYDVMYEISGSCEIERHSLAHAILVPGDGGGGGGGEWVTDTGDVDLPDPIDIDVQEGDCHVLVPTINNPFSGAFGGDLAFPGMQVCLNMVSPSVDLPFIGDPFEYIAPFVMALAGLLIYRMLRVN